MSAAIRSCLLASFGLTGWLAAGPAVPPGAVWVPSMDANSAAKAARQLRREGHPAAALARLDLLTGAALDDQRVVGERIQALLDLGCTDEALAAAADARLGSRPALPLLVAKVRLDHLSGQHERALGLAQAGLASAPKHVDLHVECIRLLTAAERWSDAQRALSELPETCPEPLARRAEAEWLLARGRLEMQDADLLERAVPRLQRALQLDPGAIEVRCTLVDALLRFNRNTLARQIVTEALPGSQGEDRRRLRRSLAAVQRSLFELTEAFDTLRELLDEDPTDGATRLGLARCHLRADDYDAAARELQLLLDAAQQAGVQADVDALLTLAETEMHRRNPEQVEVLLRDVLARKPNHLKAMYMLSCALRLAGKHDQAAEILQRYSARKADLARSAQQQPQRP